MEQLIQEAVVTVPRALIGETIDMVAVLAGRGSERRLAELARVDGLGPDGDFALTHLPCPSPVSAAPVATVLSAGRSEEHTSELQSLMRISYAVFCLKKKNERT